jgi:long-subunit acyl-CoA synthetase (AMP-forming)
MSELSPIGTFTSDYNIKSGSVGPLVSNTIGKVIDPKTGQSLAPYQPGELVIKVNSHFFTSTASSIKVKQHFLYILIRVLK